MYRYHERCKGTSLNHLRLHKPTLISSGMLFVQAAVLDY